jgi:hypothetical protein
MKTPFILFTSCALVGPALAVSPSQLNSDGSIPLPAIHQPAGDDLAHFRSADEASSDLLFAYRLHCIHGQLTATNILVSLGRYDEAEIHSIRQPLIFYDKLAAEIERRRLASFASSLSDLAAAVARKEPGSEIYPLIADLQSAIWIAYDTISYDHRESLSFKLDLAVMILNEIAGEYRMAWQGLKLSKLDRFQNAYGLLMEARLLMARVIPMVRLKDPGKAGNIENAFIRLQGAFPSIDPPRKPVLPASTIDGLVAAIEVNARKAKQ